MGGLWLSRRIIVGNYEISATQSEPPPPEWTPGTAVKLEASGDSLYLRSATGSLRLHITQRKTAGPMQPVTPEEKKHLSELDAPPQSMVGFSKAGEAGSGETQLSRREAGVQGLDERDDDHGGIRADAGCDAGKAIASPRRDQLRSAGTGQSPSPHKRIEITGSFVNLCVPGGSGFRNQPQRTQGAQGKVIRLPT